MMRVYFLNIGSLSILLLATFCRLQLILSSSQPPEIKVYHDVCVVKLGECNHNKKFERKFCERSKLPSSKEVGRTVSGVTVMLAANHGWRVPGYTRMHPDIGRGGDITANVQKIPMFDWTNYQHWTESCFLFHALVADFTDNIRQKVLQTTRKDQTISKVTTIAFPHVQPGSLLPCDDIESVPGISAVLHVEKGVNQKRTSTTVSQGFIGLARGAVASLQRVLSPPSASHIPQKEHKEKLLFCQDIKPKEDYSNNSATTRTLVTCFDTVVELDPLIPHILDSNVRLNETRKRLFQADVRSVMKLPIELTSNNFHDIRPITLLTRKRGPEWTNINYVVKGLTRAINIANTFNARNRTNAPKYTFQYVGHAEDFGIHNQCYTLKDQIELWSNSWLVISPHGAHESNVLFMHPDSDGLIEAFACGHRQTYFEVFAKYSNVPYHFAQEKDNGERYNCSEELGRTYLKASRRIGFEHDTILQVLYEEMQVPLHLQQYS